MVVNEKVADRTIFLSTPSARRATNTSFLFGFVKMYFYPRPPRGGRQQRHIGDVHAVIISIHALREEGDPYSGVRSDGSIKFLSTPSARRATEVIDSLQIRLDISIHALREEGDLARWVLICGCSKISIHALREEGDSKNRDKISIFL